MKETATAEGKRWIEQARHDLAAARDLMATERYNVSCFLAQQAAEKALKGYLIIRGAEEPWGHSVAVLLEQAQTFDAHFGELVEIGKRLDKLYIPTRYPNGLPAGIPATAYTRTEAEEALHWAGRILQAVTEGASEGTPRGSENMSDVSDAPQRASKEAHP